MSITHELLAALVTHPRLTVLFAEALVAAAERRPHRELAGSDVLSAAQLAVDLFPRTNGINDCPHRRRLFTVAYAKVTAQNSVAIWARGVYRDKRFAPLAAKVDLLADGAPSTKSAFKSVFDEIVALDKAAHVKDAPNEETLIRTVWALWARGQAPAGPPGAVRGGGQQQRGRWRQPCLSLPPLCTKGAQRNSPPNV